MTEDSTSYRHRLFLEANARRKECQNWFLRFMRPGQERLLTKQELFEIAKAELNISRSNFDAAWILAIETNGRQDWYEPLRRRKKASTRKH
jgi:nitrogen fixation protein FixH